VRTGDIQTARTIVGLDIGLPDQIRVTLYHSLRCHSQDGNKLAEADKERGLRLVESKRADAEVVAHTETKRTAKISRVQLPGMGTERNTTRKARAVAA
jgi:hemolysin activation/secretion protein